MSVSVAPDHLLLCWLGSIAFIMITIGCIMIMTHLGRTSLSTDNYQEQCLLRNTHAARKDMVTMNTNIYVHVLVNNNEVFDPSKLKAVLDATIKHHPSYIINVFVLFNDMSEGSYRRNSRFKDWELYHRGIGKYEFFDTSSAETDDNTDTATINFGDRNGNLNSEKIKIVQSTFTNYFKHSPLRSVWKNIPHEIIPVVMRVLTLWEHGGISLPIQMFLDKTNIYCQNKSANSKLHDLVTQLKKNFSETAIDSIEAAKNKKDELKLFKNGLQGVSAEKGLHSDDIKEAFMNLKGGYAQAVASSYVNPNSDTKSVSDESKTDLSEGYAPSSASPPKDDSKARLVKHLNKIPGNNHSSRYESSDYESYDYSDESFDGLPSSIELASRSDELDFKPKANVNDEIRRFVNGKITNDDIKKRLEDMEKRNRIRREIYAISSSESVSREEIIPTQPERIISYDPPQVPAVRKPIKDISDSVSNEVIRRIKNALQRQAVLPKPLMDFQKDYNSLEKKPDTSSSSSGSASYLSLSSSRSYDSRRSDSDSTQSLYDKLHPISDTIRRPKIKIRENNDYKQMKFFKELNIFSMPTKFTLTLDEAGYYLSTRKPCHAFLGQLIAILQKKSNFYAAEDLISDGLKSFCGVRDYAECKGIALLS